MIGGATKFLKGPLNLIDEGTNALGQAWTLNIFHKKMTFLIGPEVTTHFFKAKDTELSQKEVRHSYSMVGEMSSMC